MFKPKWKRTKIANFQCKIVPVCHNNQVRYGMSNKKKETLAYEVQNLYKEQYICIKDDELVQKWKLIFAPEALTLVHWYFIC